MAKCAICGRNLGLADKRYKFPGNIQVCFECMTCSICGSKANGERRGIIELQPFCEKHFEEAQVLMSKPVEEWPDIFIKAKLAWLPVYKRFLQAQMNAKFMRSSLLGALGVFTPPSIATLGLITVLGQGMQLDKNALDSIDSSIRQLQDILARRKGLKTEGTTKDEDPITILKIRFAKGEISKEQYEEMLQTLSKEPPTSREFESSIVADSEKLRTCPHCGSKSSSNAKFCSGCGMKLD